MPDEESLQDVITAFERASQRSRVIAAGFDRFEGERSEPTRSLGLREEEAALTERTDDEDLGLDDDFDVPEFLR